MSTDSSNPILRRLGVAGVGDEKHFKSNPRSLVCRSPGKANLVLCLDYDTVAAPG